MFRLFADNRNRNSVAYKMRKNRAALLEKLLKMLDEPIRILDVGGTEAYWISTGLAGNMGIQVTLLNLEENDVSLSNFFSVKGDARDLKFEDSSFDIVFSNSVIEHVGDFDDQIKMAMEVQRVGERYFVQTPNKYFPIEPHFLFPLFQFLPKSTKIWLLRNFRLGWFPKTPDEISARKIIEGIHLIDKKDFRKMFQDAKIYEEKFFGMTKSFIAYDGWD